jgi:peptide chain release factor
MLNVSPRKEKALRDEMSRLGISENDISESFLKSGGKGGQHVNKVSTCVYLKHLPTGTEVKCSRGRSQSANRFFARRILIEKIEKAVTGRVARQRALSEKIRRQKRKRSKRAKEKMLKDKKALSAKKRSRKAPAVESEE